MVVNTGLYDPATLPPPEPNPMARKFGDKIDRGDQHADDA